MAIIFWSEFPEEVNWNRVNKEIDFDTEVFITCKNKREFLDWKKNIRNKRISVGAWPVLEKKEGYWFSGQTSKECLDRLDEFNDIPVKLDFEPRIFPGRFKSFKALLWMIKWMMMPGKNKDYLIEKIKTLDKNSIISGFILPRFLLRRVGQTGNCRKNFICYTSFFPRWIRWIALAYYKIMIRHLGRNNFYAIGIANHGIFGNEPAYKSKEELIADLEFMKKLGVKNIVVYSIEGILKRDWINIVRFYAKDKVMPH